MEFYVFRFYAFLRKAKEPTDTLLHSVGPAGLYTGMIKSAFRPSDDALRLPFNIASNAFAVMTLTNTAAVFEQIGEQDISGKLNALAHDIEEGIRNYGMDVLNGGYFYEVDGYGSHYFMDDGNVPSLLSLPYLGYVSSNNSDYLKTRMRLLSKMSNPYYFEGVFAKGIGSPHTIPDYVWPMGLIIQAMTSNNDTEIMELLDVLKKTTAGTMFMHESFFVDDPRIYTRSWFAWCNNLFGDLILQLIDRRPWLVI